MNRGYVVGIILFIIIIITIVLVLFFFVGPNKTTNNNNKPVRSPCTSTNQCAPGLTCTDGQCLSPIGGSCSNINDCVSDATACFQGICTTGVLSGPGGQPPCMPGLIVDDGKCVVPDLSPCNSSSDCKEGSHCSNGICMQKKRGFGKHCSDRIHCDPGFTCDDEKCKIANNSNIPCMDDHQCESGSHCLKNRCVNEDESSSSSDYSSSSYGSRSSSSKSSSFCPRSSKSSSSRKWNKSSRSNSSKNSTSKSNSSSSLSSNSSSSNRSGTNHKNRKHYNSSDSSTNYRGFNIIDANIEPGSSSTYNTMEFSTDENRDDNKEITNLSNGIILTSGAYTGGSTVSVNTGTSVISKELIRRLKK